MKKEVLDKVLKEVQKVFEEYRSPGRYPTEDTWLKNDVLKTIEVALKPHVEE